MTDKEQELVNKICSRIDSPLRSQVETQVKMTLALQNKLEENYDKYLKSDLAFTFVKKDGNSLTRANPFVTEYRALFKDYVNAVKDLKQLCADVGLEEEMSTLAAVKEKFKIAK